MKIQCTDAQSAEAIACHAAQYRFQEHGVTISADGNTLDVVPANSLVSILSAMIGKAFDLLLDRPEREAPQQQGVSGDIVTS